MTRERVRQIVGSHSLPFGVGKNTKYRLSHPKPPRKTLAERFWEKVDIRTEDDCWNWKNSKYPTGYGHFSSGKPRRGRYSHRVAWELTYGPIPEDKCICHHCDNPSCCNPKHLFLGTTADNMHDRDRKGHNNNGKKLPRKIKVEDIENIYKEYKPGKPHYAGNAIELGEKYHVTAKYIQAIANKYHKSQILKGD